MISCYEAGYDGFWLHRLLEGQGVHSLVVDPASVQVDRRARRAKTVGAIRAVHAALDRVLPPIRDLDLPIPFPSQHENDPVITGSE
jgi:transposase